MLLVREGSAAAQAVLAKARKIPKATPEFRGDVESFEGRLLEIATERKEDEATAKVRISCRATHDSYFSRRILSFDSQCNSGHAFHVGNDFRLFFSKNIPQTSK